MCDERKPELQPGQGLQVPCRQYGAVSGGRHDGPCADVSSYADEEEALSILRHAVPHCVKHGIADKVSSPCKICPRLLPEVPSMYGQDPRNVLHNDQGWLPQLRDIQEAAVQLVPRIPCIALFTQIV